MQSSESVAMNNFPEFIKKCVNEVEVDDIVEGTVGYVFDGIEGTQVVFWECKAGGKSVMHVHDYDEYVIVVQGTCEYTVGEKQFTIGPGDEYHVPAGIPHGGILSPNYRAIDVFGMKRFERKNS